VKDSIAELRQALEESVPVVALTGAGISAESGVPTFRGANGLWRNFPPEKLATPEAFAENPRLVWEWYDWRRSIIREARPNAGHLALVELERRKTAQGATAFTLVTQNVDGLHDRAGNRNTVKLHGDLWLVRCTGCGAVERNEEVPLRGLPPHCRCGALLRPGVVWFGEPLPPDAWERAARASSSARIFLVIGTSGLVYPAASLPEIARRHGAYLVEINIEPTLLSSLADEVIQGTAAAVLPDLLGC